VALGVGLAARQGGQQDLIDRIAAAPRDIAARLELAKLYVAQNRLDDAERVLNEALTLVRAQKLMAAERAVSTTAGDTPIRIDGSLGDVKEPQLVRHVAPVYPKIAITAKFQGFVVLEVIVDREGRVTDTKVLRSSPMFDQAAIDAVRQWRYGQTTINGKAVPVAMSVTVHFNIR
jgi:TonB family protein